MSLPKIKHPLYDFTIPSTGKKYSFRPFLVKEEKILLMAKSSEDGADIFRAIKQVINNCSIDKSFDVNKLAVFDLEYLFLQLRSVSVSNTVKVSYRDNEDESLYDFEIDLKSVTVKFPESIEKTIKVSETIGIKMKYPSASIFEDKDYFNSGSNAYYELIVRCIDCIYDEETVHNVSDYKPEEIEEFLNDCGVNVFEKIQEFMGNVPKLYHKLEYKNKLGNNRVIELASLSDFFSLG